MYLNFCTMKRESVIKLVVALIIGFAASSDALAQIGIRADFGFDMLSSFYRDPKVITVAPGIGAKLGVDYDIHVKGRFYITPGLYWSYRSAYDYESVRKSVSVHIDSGMHEHSLDVPVHVKWKFDLNPDRLGMYVFLGPTLSCGLSSNVNMDMMCSWTETGWNYSSPKLMRITGRYNNYTGRPSFESNWDSMSSSKLNTIVREAIEAVGYRYNRFEARFEVGCGFIFKEHYELAMGFDLGFTDRLRGEVSREASELWQSFHVGFRYRF